MRRQFAPPAGGRHRSLSDALAAGRQWSRTGGSLANNGRPAKRRKGPVDRRLEFHRRADRARGENCGGDFAAASLFVDPPADRNGNTRVLREAGNWRHRVFADGIRLVDRRDDAWARCKASRRRLAEAQPGVPRTQSFENLKLLERLKKVAARYGRTPSEVAIVWTLRSPAVTGAIVGARNAKQAEGVMRGGDLKLTPQDIAEIDGTAVARAGR